MTDETDTKTTTSRLMVRVTSAQQAELTHLVDIGYGNGKTPASMVEYIIARFLDDVRRKGIYYVNQR